MLLAKIRKLKRFVNRHNIVVSFPETERDNVVSDVTITSSLYVVM